MVRSNLYILTLLCGMAVAMPALSETAPELTAELTAEQQAEIADLMEQAKQAMMEAEYQIAIKNYSKLVDMADHAYRRDALELLGLAFERYGDFEQAKRVYQRYIQLYTEVGLDLERVRQRLAGLETAAWSAPKKLSDTKRPAKDDWRVYGSFSQYLRRDASKFEDQPEVEQQLSLSTYLDINARRRTDAYDIKTRFSGGLSHDLTGEADHLEQLSYLYLDATLKESGWAGRIGRQRANGGGVLGRFDGVNFSKRLTDKFSLGVVAGMPVKSSREISPDSDRTFYGVNVQTGPWAEHWDVNGYYIQQQAFGMLDRQAVGGEIRYNTLERNLYTLVDYDLSYSMLNIFSVQGSLTFADKSSVNMLVDFRNSPSIFTTNALIGQTATTLDELKQSYTEDEIRQLAEDRTARYYMTSLGYNKPLSERWRWNVDLTASNLGATSASGGVVATLGTENEYYLYNRLTATELFSKGDVHMFGLRMADTDSYESNRFFLNSRWPAGDKWRINPRMNMDWRDYKTSGDKEQTIEPSLRLEYNWTKLRMVEIDTGISMSRRTTWFGVQDSQDYYISIGYRIGF